MKCPLILIFLYIKVGNSLLRPEMINAWVEYCSVENPGKEKICRDTQATIDFNDNQLRIHGAVMTYDVHKNFQQLIFGYGNCISRKNQTYLRLLPGSSSWMRRPDTPFLIIISDKLDVYTNFVDEKAEIPLYGGKSHVMILNGELRSFRGDVHRRCVVPTPTLHGVNYYHFSDRLKTNDINKKYMLTSKDKIFTGKEEVEECKLYAKMDEDLDIFHKKKDEFIIPDTFEQCKMDCGPNDIAYVFGRNRSELGQEDEDAGLPGLVVIYAMNETEKGVTANREFAPTFNGMLTAMYDTEVPEEYLLPRSLNSRRTRSAMRDINLRHPFSLNWPFWDIGGFEEGPIVRRDKRLTYSSAVHKANTLYKGDEGKDELICVG